MLLRLFINKLFLIVFQALFLLGLFYSYGIAGEGISWGRFLIRPQIAIEEQYSDNVFLEPEDKKIDDNIVTISPGLSSYLATTENSRLGLHYNGDFSFYSKNDDLNDIGNEGIVDWSLTTPSDSTFEIGTKILDTSIISDTSIQPDDVKKNEDQSNPSDDNPYLLRRDKPYLLKTAYADTNLKPGEFTEVGFRYEYKSREFDELTDSIDDYNRNLFRMDYVNRYLSMFPLLLEYRYTINKRNDLEDPANDSRSLEGSARDSRSNEIYVGARWTPETRLSGNLRIGYQNTNYEGIEDVDTLVTDTALSYRLTEVTTVQLKVIRRLNDSTNVENDPGDNYTSTNYEGKLLYSYSEPLKLSFRLRYQEKKFEVTEGVEDMTETQKDDIYNTRIGLEYIFNQWMDFSLSYQYSQKNSDDETREYSENSGFFGVRLSL